MLRALAIEAFYSDFVAPGAEGPGAWEEIDFRFPLASQIQHDWSYPGGSRMSERFDVVVSGSGAGGGVVAGELAQRGRSVVLLEAGPHLTAADFVRWEAKAAHDFWWPLRMAMVDGGAGGTVPIFGGRCVGGTTTMNTKVCLPRARLRVREVARRERAARRRRRAVRGRGPRVPTTSGSSGSLGVRERADWPECVRTLDAAFRELGSELEPVDSYTDVNCMKCGSCLQGCPTNAGKNTMNTYIHAATAVGKLDLRADSPGRAGPLRRPRGRLRGDRRRVHRRRRAERTRSRPAPSSSRPGRSTRRRS